MRGGNRRLRRRARLWWPLFLLFLKNEILTLHMTRTLVVITDNKRFRRGGLSRSSLYRRTRGYLRKRWKVTARTVSVETSRLDSVLRWISLAITLWMTSSKEERGSRLSSWLQTTSKSGRRHIRNLKVRCVCQDWVRVLQHIHVKQVDSRKSIWRHKDRNSQTYSWTKRLHCFMWVRSYKMAYWWAEPEC